MSETAVIVPDRLQRRDIARPVVSTEVSNPLQLLAIAVSQGADIDKLRELRALQKEFEADEARKAFNAALAAFKKNVPTVVKDMLNKQYGSKYASIASYVNTINPALAEHGLSVNWEFEQAQQISVTCILEHVAGHSKRVKLSGAPDASGAKNNLQQIKSTVTYLEIATFQAVTGVVAADANADDDGNGADARLETLSEKQVADLKALITEHGIGMPALLTRWKIRELSEIPVINYETSVADVKAIASRRQQRAQ